MSVVANIIEIIDENSVIVNIQGVTKKVSTSLLTEKCSINDWILIHTGFAIAKISEEKALTILKAYEIAELDVRGF